MEGKRFPENNKSKILEVGMFLLRCVSQCDHSAMNGEKGQERGQRQGYS